MTESMAGSALEPGAPGQVAVEIEPVAAAAAIAEIAVTYGAPGRVVAEIERAARPRIAWLTGASTTPSAWLGARQLCARIAELVDHAALDAIVRRHRPVLAIVAPAIVAPDALTGDERAARDALCADLRSHHVHSTASWQPLIDAAAALIADLAGTAGAAIAVPELADLDAATAHALREAWRVHSHRLRELWLGHDPELTRPTEVAWGVPVSWTIAQVRAQLCDYQLAPGCRVAWLAADGPTAPAPAPASSAPGPDAIALAVLATARAPTPVELAGCVAAMRWAIHAYGFGAAFRIGALLDGHRDRLDRDDQAAHAQLTAIAATCAHFVDTPTPGFDERLDAMSARAIELAGDPIDAAALAVRRAFAAVERGVASPARQLDAAAACVAHLADDLVASYHGAWLAVARALHLLHAAPLVVAAQEVEQACAAIDLADRRAEAAGAPALRRELASARFVILAHAATDAAPDQPALAARWLAQAERDRARLSLVHRFEVQHWVLLAQRDDDRAAIYARCAEGIRDAERCWEAGPWYLYRALAADSAYRLGRLAEATGHVRALLATSRFGHPGVALVGDLAVLARRVLLRAGADDELIAAVTGAASRDADGQALIARAAAARGDARTADAALEQAIEDAVACGDHAVMCRVAVIAAQVMIALDRAIDARAALDAAWQLAEDEPGQWAASVAPADCLRLCLAEADQRGAPVALVERALAVLPACMLDADSWWDVADVLDLLLARPEAAASDAARAGLNVVRHLARNRAAWRTRLAALDRA